MQEDLVWWGECTMHRNSQKRVYGDHVYFITCNVQGVYLFFENEILCELWINELQLTKKNTCMKLFAFCLNYDHFHLLIKPNNSVANYSKIMQFLKRHSSRNINIILGYNIYDTHKHSTEGDIGQYRLRDVNNNAQYRLRVVNQKFDQTIIKLRESFKQKYGKNHDIPKFKWQKSFYDHVIRNKSDFDKHIKYTMYNYCKHELPEDWKYTGLKYREMLDEID